MLHQLNVFHSGDMRHVKVSAFASKNSASTRIALACISCRSKHLKCDAATPVCSRCRADDKQCTYLKSRRGGRRSRKPTEPQAKGPLDQLPDVQSQSLSPFGINHSEWMINDNMPDFARNVSTDSSESYQRPPAEAPSEELLDLYYSFFHNAHPCVLPRRYLAKRLEVDAEAFQPVLLVMQYIGSIYTNSVPSEPLEVAVIEVLAEDLDSSEVNGHYVQALMLYSIAVFWRNDIERGLKLLDRAISKAIQIGMNTQDFAMTYGEGFPVLEESWRRTWWLMCVADAHIAGSTHTYPFRMTNLSVEVDLPCDEDRYDAGDIPRPKSLSEYETREFTECDGDFSSFAELVGLIRALGVVFSQGRRFDHSSISTMITNFDASITGWCSLLPQSKKKLFRSDGTLDEQLFRAEILINTYVVDIHRPLSDLAYCAIESVSRCAPPAPKHTPIPSNHTPRILRAIESFNRLLTLSGSLKVHTPFIICMIANTTVAYLSACKHIFDNISVKLAREKIRMNMGLLKALGKHWPLAERTYQEVGIIAREILCLLDHDVSPPTTYCLVGRSSHSTSPPIFDLDHEIDLATLLGFEQMGF